ncbi:hypothetical protein Hanom_Chr03g00243261 [Helianthus anomalus]
MKPPQQGNQHPFNRNQVANNEREIVPANNSNRALIVQTDECCDWSVQLGNSGGRVTAYYAEIVKNDSSDRESSRNDDSSWDSSSSDEAGSTSSEDRSKDVGAEVDDVTTGTESTDIDETSLEHETEGSSDEFSKHLSSIGSSTLRATFIARLDCQSSQVSFDKAILAKCVECMVLKGKYLELEGKLDHTKKHHQSMIVELTKCTEAKTALRVGLCTVHDAIKLKLDSYSNSRYILDHIIDAQKKKGDVKCIGYKACPPSVRHNYTKMPDDEDIPHFEPTVPLDFDEFTAGLGFTKGVSSSQSQSDDINDSKSVNDQSPPIVEDCASSDDESDTDKPKQSDTVTKEENIPLENHILCDPPRKPFVTATVKSVESSSESCESRKISQ